jgi:hypothetical protein
MYDIHEFRVDCPPRNPRVAAATSGQVFIHEVLRGLSPSNGHTNFEIGFFINEHALADVEKKVRQLLQEVESLRTVWSAGSDGRLVQELPATMIVGIRIVRGTPDGNIRNARRMEPFMQGDLPVRIYLYTALDDWFVSFVVSHLSIDKWGREVLREHLERLFLGADRQPASRWHPIDQSLFEQSEEAQRVRRQSERYWRSTLGEFPKSIAEGARSHSAHSHWWRVQLNSPSLGSAVTQLAGGAGVSRSVVALTLAAIVIGVWFDTDTFHTMMLSANRFDPRYARAIGAYAQTVPISLRTDADTFAQLARENFGAALKAYRHSSISPYVSKEILEEFKLSGEPKYLDTMVNIYIFDTSSEMPTAPLRDSNDSKITWLSNRDNEITNVSFDCSESSMILLQANTKYIPKNIIEKLLHLYYRSALSFADNDHSSPRNLANALLNEM